MWSPFCQSFGCPAILHVNLLRGMTVPHSVKKRKARWQLHGGAVVGQRTQGVAREFVKGAAADQRGGRTLKVSCRTADK